MIRVLIVDDSSTSRMLLRHIVTSAPDMQVIGELTNGREALNQIRKLRPDIILMDIVMPEMDGMDATGEIMAIQPTPIVMISATLQGRETEMAFQALKRGALTLLPKPDGPQDPAFQEQANRLTNTLRAMADVRVIHHHTKERKPTLNPDQTPLQQTLAVTPEIIGIAASTGGPAALAEIFQRLPGNFSLPIVVVQHIAGDFLNSLITWLNHVSPLSMQLAPIGEPPKPGVVYFAPTGQHLYLNKQRRFAQADEPRTHHMPSGDVLLESLAQQYEDAAIGIVLTGMGADGANGLWHLRKRGAVTIGQNEQTCAVYGMPKEAQQLGAVQYSLSLNMIAPMLKDLSERETHEPR